VEETGVPRKKPLACQKEMHHLIVLQFTRNKTIDVETNVLPTLDNSHSTVNDKCVVQLIYTYTVYVNDFNVGRNVLKTNMN
jgi:hypothetical protein